MLFSHNNAVNLALLIGVAAFIVYALVMCIVETVRMRKHRAPPRAPVRRIPHSTHPRPPWW